MNASAREATLFQAAAQLMPQSTDTINETGIAAEQWGVKHVKNRDCAYLAYGRTIPILSLDGLRLIE